jgi:hypothetical protein
MSRFVRFGALTLVAFVIAACSDATSSPDPVAPRSAPSFSASQSNSDQVMAGEVIVKFRNDADVDVVAKEHGLGYGYGGYKNSFYVLRGAAGNEHANANALKNDARVEYAEPNYLRQPTAINPKLWAFYNPGGLNMRFTTGKSNGQLIPSSYASIADADEDNIENYAAGGSDVVIGSIDTGVDLTHPEFAGRLILGMDWYSNDNSPADED